MGDSDICNYLDPNSDSCVVEAGRSVCCRKNFLTPSNHADLVSSFALFALSGLSQTVFGGNVRGL